jgi:acetyl esterase/lipase
VVAVRPQRIPFFAIHGDVDELVPLEVNSGALCSNVKAAGGDMELIVAAGQGHNMWDGFFQCEALVQFVIEHAQRVS